MEICYVPRTPVASQYPGIFLFTTPARMVRPVQNLAQGKAEMLGTFEQVYMDIAITPSEAIKGVSINIVFNLFHSQKGLGRTISVAKQSQSTNIVIVKPFFKSEH